MAESRNVPIVAAAITAAGAVAAALVGVLLAVDPPPGTPTPAPSTSTSTPAPPPDPSPGGSSSLPPRSEVEDLISILPANSSACAPEASPLGARAHVRCTAMLDSAPIGTVYYRLYEGMEPSRQAFEEVVPPQVAASDRSCPQQDRDDWHINARDGRQIEAGLLACWVASDNARPYIVWSWDDPGILAIAEGAVGGGADQLWQWWQHASLTTEP